MRKGQNRCEARCRDGSACEAQVGDGERFCFFHDPERARQLAEGRTRGGQSRSRPRATLDADTTPVAVSSVKDVCSLISTTIHDVRTGRLDPKVANTVGYLASVLVRALEVGELEERLAMLEAAARRSSGPTGAFNLDLPDEGGV